jgi:hypothetical protein
MEYHLMRASEGLLVVHAVGHSELLLGIVDADAPLGTAVHDLGWCAARLGEQR